MTSLLEVRHVSTAIARPPEDVYAFASKVENLPRWASGLAGSITEENGQWVAESPLGRITIRFAAKNAFGVLDHDVVLPSGKTVHNALRVVPNGQGSEVVFSVFREPGVTDEKFETDVSWVAKDLKALKDLLEK